MQSLVRNEDDEAAAAADGLAAAAGSLFFYPFMHNVTRTGEYLRIATNKLHDDPLYYNIYCLGLNTFFATVIPFVLLIFFNISIVLSLSKLGKQVGLKS
jgi:hypothetical protein